MNKPESDAFVFFRRYRRSGVQKDLFPRCMPWCAAAAFTFHHRHGARRLELGQAQGPSARQPAAERRFRPRELDKLAALLRYVDGDYADPETFTKLKSAIGLAKSPIHYLRDSAEHVRQRDPGTAEVRLRR